MTVKSNNTICIDMPSFAMIMPISIKNLPPKKKMDISRNIHEDPKSNMIQDVVKAMELMRKKSEKLQAEFTEASQRAVKVKSVDVCFALDCTGSMGSQIQAAKEKIFEIQNRMETCLGQGGNVRFAVVGYRDYGDQEQFQSLPLTEDVKEVRSGKESLLVSFVLYVQVV